MTLRSMWVLTGSNSRHNCVAYFGRSNKIQHTIVLEPCIASTNEGSTCVARHATHHDGILMWNEPSLWQRGENTNLYFQKDIP